jgi:hypothetical protein
MKNRHENQQSRGAPYSPDEAAWFRGRDREPGRRRLARGTTPLGVEALPDTTRRPAWWRRLLDELE